MIASTTYIIKTQSNIRQVKFAGLVIGEFETLQDTKDFVSNYEHSYKVQVWKDDELIESYIKPVLSDNGSS